MKVYKFDIPSGALEVCILEECPISFPSSDTRRVYLYPAEGTDLECTVTKGADVLSRATLDVVAVLSCLFGRIRGIPECALSVRYEGTELDLPKLCTPPDIVRVPLPKCKYIFTKNEYFEGGIPESLTTVSASEVSRVILATRGSPYPMPLLRRSRIVKGIPDAVRAIAYYPDGDGFRAISTDRHESADSIAPLAYLLLSDRESATVTTRTGTYTFVRHLDAVFFCAPVTISDK